MFWVTINLPSYLYPVLESDYEKFTVLLAFGSSIFCGSFISGYASSHLLKCSQLGAFN